MILTTDIWSGAHSGSDRSAEDAYSSAAPDPTFAFVGSPCCPTLDFVIVTNPKNNVGNTNQIMGKLRAMEIAVVRW
jgi:hypothetical protein